MRRPYLKMRAAGLGKATGRTCASSAKHTRASRLLSVALLLRCPHEVAKDDQVGVSIFLGQLGERGIVERHAIHNPLGALVGQERENGGGERSKRAVQFDADVHRAATMGAPCIFANGVLTRPISTHECFSKVV